MQMHKNRGLLGGYVKKLRKENGIPAEELCRGLCSVQQLYAVEKETRELDKLVLDAVMERLGVGAEDYEHLLDYPEYKRWEDRQHILHAITFEEFETAEQRLEEYYTAYCKNEVPAGSSGMDAVGKLELQFYLCMRTLLMSCTGGARGELEEGYRHALELTVPEPEQRPLAGRALSLKELNLILETEHYRRDGGRPERYMEVITYIENRKLDQIGWAKIYPKAVYFLCCRVTSEPNSEIMPHCPGTEGELSETAAEKPGPPQTYRNGDWTAEHLLQYCNKAYEVLRKGKRMYFLWEILSMREYYIERLRKQWSGRGEAKKSNSLCFMFEENRKLRLTLEQTYREWGIRKETFEFCYLHVIKEVYCINDIIRVRRNMLEIKAETLCEGICTVKTLHNIESRKTVPQRQVADELLERLGLSKDRTRTELVTDNQKARDLMRQLRDKINNKCYEEADKILDALRKEVSDEIKYNRQVLKHKEVLINRRLGKLSDEKYLEKMKEVLEITLPLEAFIRKGQKYLTNMEQTCILNMMKDMNKESGEFLNCMHRFEEMYQPIIQKGMQETVTNMYEFIMDTVGSMLGNRGEYDKSDEINMTIIMGCLRFRRVSALHGVLYGRWWNHNEHEKQGIPVDILPDRISELEKCIQLAQFTRENNDVRFYQKKLEE